MSKLYPRRTFKTILKAHTSRRLSKNIDILIYLDYLLFLNTLIGEAIIQARQSNEKRIRGFHIQKTAQNVLDRFRG
ncbi:hypothetical protein PCANB_000659 [Pneumocystis canis]|nr:hypothetical protein PCK1_000644 [Pneumocystis canis]KAG5437622.1 hypothetical protein PCANB_000659 [Pneumocystis canis]